MGSCGLKAFTEGGIFNITYLVIRLTLHRIFIPYNFLDKYIIMHCSLLFSSDICNEL